MINFKKLVQVKVIKSPYKQRSYILRLSNIIILISKFITVEFVWYYIIYMLILTTFESYERTPLKYVVLIRFQ